VGKKIKKKADSWGKKGGKKWLLSETGSVRGDKK